MKKEYAVLVDHKAVYSDNENYSPVMIGAGDLMEAMTSAEKYMDETVYLIKILERISGVKRGEGCKVVDFVEVLVNRGHGWYKVDTDHFENRSTWSHVMSASRSFKWDYWELVSTEWN